MQQIHKRKQYTVLGLVVTLFLVLTIWWLYIYIGLGGVEEKRNLIWAASYQLVAIVGGISGIAIARKWGGIRSVMGRAILFFSFGLLLQTFGQTVFSYYNLFLHTPVPYPSIADIGFFVSIPFYIYAAIELAKVSGVGSSLKSVKGWTLAITFPLLVLFLSYMIFLRSYVVDSGQALKTIFDFGYPLGQAVYVSIAALGYILSRKFLGGIMRPKIVLILIALFIQYIADFNFLYQANRGTWINGGYGDFIYLVAYFAMAYSIVKIGTLFSDKHAEVIIT